MNEALHYKKLKDNLVQCQLCPRFCSIKPGEIGDCKARKNEKGELYSLVYGKLCSVNVDPIEKKPMYHFLPGEHAFSIGTTGCNLHCAFCQNWSTSQANAGSVPGMDLNPKEAVTLAMNKDCKIIAYTYNDPIVFFEYVLDTAKIARKKGLKNVIVCNGYINPKPLKEWCKYIDGANIDLKSFNPEFYKKYCFGELEPVKESLKILKKNKVWLEITNLIIPGLNDDLKEIGEMCKWIAKELGKDVPIHFSRFHPCHKMLDRAPTSVESLHKIAEVAKKHLNYVYLGNVLEKGETICPECGEHLIERSYCLEHDKLEDGCCPCGKKIPGCWEIKT
ncbi:MAG: AmmeMemoRadiSam system radical SAM enzyme [archaeon]